MKAILEQKGCSLNYIEVPQRHFWANWRGFLDEILLYFSKAKAAISVGTRKRPDTFRMAHVYPNPFSTKAVFQ